MTRRNGLFSTLALAVAGAIVATFVVSCGIRPSVVIPGQEAPHGTVTSLIVYLVDHTTLRAVNRPLPPTSTPKSQDTATFFIPYPNAQSALDALLAGPTTSEAGGGLTSEVPNRSTAFVGNSEGGVYRVFVGTGDGSSLSDRAVDQIICTVSASFISNGFPSNGSPLVQVFDKRAPQRNPQRCPATP